MDINEFYFQTSQCTLKVQTLISFAGTSSRQCSRYYERINSMRTLGNRKLQKVREEKLKAELMRGEKLENQLYLGCIRRRTSPQTNSKMLGYKQTFAQLRVKHCSWSQTKVRSKGTEDHKKEEAQVRNPFPVLRKGTLKRLFQEARTEQDTLSPAAPPLSEEENPPNTTSPEPNSSTPTNPLGERIRRVRISRLKKNKARRRVTKVHKDFPLPIYKSMRESSEKVRLVYCENKRNPTKLVDILERQG